MCAQSETYAIIALFKTYHYDSHDWIIITPPPVKLSLNKALLLAYAPNIVNILNIFGIFNLI